MKTDERRAPTQSPHGSDSSGKTSLHWVQGYTSTAAGDVPLVSTVLTRRDKTGRWKVRWGVGRSNYTVEPGLYGIGRPDGQSPVMVTANYKLTFDYVRQALHELSAWVLVLDTRGINVWCAAGKGTFGTQELIRRVESAGLAEVVKHRRLVLPQLGAVGVAAHTVKAETGFRVLYGPVRAADIPAFIENGMTVSGDMRRVTFTLAERFVLAPVELVGSVTLLLALLPVVLIFHLLQHGGFRLSLLFEALAVLGVILVGTVLTPALLPLVPARSFALKGWVLAALYTLGVCLAAGAGIFQLGVYLLLLPPIAAFIALNFTGSSTFTSLSGVLKEMRYAIPLIVVSVLLGVAGRIVLLF